MIPFSVRGFAPTALQAYPRALSQFDPVGKPPGSWRHRLRRLYTATTARRPFHHVAWRVAAALLCLAAICAGEAPRSPALAVERGLAWLRGQQQADGSLAGKYRTANTAMAALAHLSAGITPDLPEHGPAVRRMLVQLLASGDARGYCGGDGGRMYGHAMVCLALSNALGTARDDDLDERIRVALTRGIAVIVTAAQVGRPEDQRGGWRYNPDEASSDVSVTGWQLAALYAARRTGLAVPDEVFSGALAYIRSRIDADGKVGYAARGEDRPTLRGLALVSLDLQPGPRDPLRDRIVERMRAEPPVWSGPWFFYRTYYDATGVSRCEPALWKAWREPLTNLLVANQGKDGSWPAPPGDNEREYGAIYATALATLALTVDLRLLPSN